jgi:hypothetical protein
VYWLEAVNCCIKGETIKGDLTQEFYDQAQWIIVEQEAKFFFFYETKVWTQGFILLLSLEPHLWAILFSLFWRWWSQELCMAWLWTEILLISVSQIARISHQCLTQEANFSFLEWFNLIKHSFR